eukprot:scaffold28807_cov67-Phaeocystis_antarctica.AAC.11
MFGRAVALEREHLELGQELSVALLREHLPCRGRGVGAPAHVQLGVRDRAPRTRVGGRRLTSAGDSSSFSL